MSKEGLALLNGTQFMSANGIKALIDGWHLVNCFDLFGAMSLEAFDGRIEPFFDCIQQVSASRTDRDRQDIPLAVERQ
jgi:histidine ammonia-lyase